MKLGFTEDIVRLMDLAQERSKSDNVKFIAMDHILAVLLKWQDDEFQRRMRDLGIKPESVVSNFEIPCQYFQFSIPSGVEFSNASEKVLRAAMEVAVAQNRNVKPSDILYVILTNLDEHGVIHERLGLVQGKADLRILLRESP
jgi:ATP-dependent Clp protease ATP-binding subunit ClpA